MHGVLTVLAVGHGKGLSGTRREQDGHDKKEPHRPPAAPSCWWLHARETTLASSRPEVRF
jgi:hypothetical protein